MSVVREAIGPVAAFRNSVGVTALPRTRSGKTARKSIADLSAGKKVQVSGNAYSLNKYNTEPKQLSPI